MEQAQQVVKANGNNAVANKKQPAIKALIKSPDFLKAVSAFYDEPKNAQRFVQSALNAIVSCPKLLDCTPESVIGCQMKLAQLNLNPDGRNAHLIPYGRVCTLIVDYKGMVQIVRRNPNVISVGASPVYSKDTYRETNDEYFHEVSNPFGDRGELVGFYAYCRYKNGGCDFTSMSKEKVDAIRARSRAANSGPWVTDYIEMAKKTVFKNLCKWLSMPDQESADALRTAIEEDDKAMGFASQQKAQPRKTLSASDILNFDSDDGASSDTDSSSDEVIKED